MTKVFVVILNWNGWEDTVECIASLTKSTQKLYEQHIVVVDNNSTNDSVKELRKINGITLLENTENLGFAGGNNVGITHSLKNGADYVCILNNDTIVDKKCIDELVQASIENPKAGILSPKIYFAKGFEFHKDRYSASDRGRVIWYAGGDMDWNNIYGSNHGVDEVDNGQFDETRKIDFATGACMLVTREAFEVSLFDEKYFLYLEDTDFSMKVKARGLDVIYVPTSIVWHKVSQSSGIGSNLNDYFITRNRLMFGMRYASLRAKYALARESVRLYFGGRPWQKKGVADYYLGRLGKGSWKN